MEELSCSRHCDKTTRFVTLFEGKQRLVGAYVCPDNYVTRLVSFEPEDHNISRLRSFVTDELEGGSLVRDSDFRKATRHGWELGPEAEEEIKLVSSKGIQEYYWTFYPKGREKKLGNFLCDECGKLFIQTLDSKNKTCDRH